MNYSIHEKKPEQFQPYDLIIEIECPRDVSFLSNAIHHYLILPAPLEHVQSSKWKELKKDLLATIRKEEIDD
jgi:hypothetical protein